MAAAQHEPLVRSESCVNTVDTILQPERQLLTRSGLMNLKQCKIKTIFVTLATIGTICLVAWLYVEHTVPSFNQYRLVKSYGQIQSAEQNENKLRFILLWNSFFNDKRWSLPDDVNDPSYFRKEIDCPIANCVVTNDRSILSKIEMYDAIVFHTAQPFPLINPIPKRRLWRQLYVFAQMKPPGETKHILRYENNFYNLTMTYRTDSDILWSSGYFVDKETGMRVMPSENPRWRSAPRRYNDSSIEKLWPYKVKMACSFVSNCETVSRREKLVEEIQKYMKVDVYGKCGSKSCQTDTPECNNILDENYKFYFSFEDSLCIDYITQELYNILERNVIPIVYGGVNYSNFLPPHSYINVNDFETPQDLVNYLKYLSENQEEYMRYFWWRQYYRVETYSPFCDLCKHLHQPNYFLKSQTYTNIEKWWLEGSCRSRSRIKF